MKVWFYLTVDNHGQPFEVARYAPLINSLTTIMLDQFEGFARELQANCANH